MSPATHNILIILLNIAILYVIYLFFIQKRVEGFTNPPLDNNNNNNNNNTIPLPSAEAGSLCTLYGTQPLVLNEKCGALTEKNCNATSCCVWLNGTSCVAGNASGPTFRTTKGKPIEVKTYSYQNTTF
jgi:hypothetical protein